jgi:predicted phage terminase large subunit-like protein
MFDPPVELEEPLEKTVEAWINEVNYSIDDCYIPSVFAVEFVTFIKMVNGSEGEENKTPVVHLRMLDQISGDKEDTINLCHRGIAKTTLLGEYLFLYIAVYGEIPGFGKVPLAIYVSDSIENGVKNMRKNLEFRWENSDFLQEYLPKAGVKFTDIRWEFNNIDGNRFIVKGYGAKTGVRGAKEMGKRPVLAVLDDLISDEDARSDTVIASVEDTVYKAVDYALHPTKSKIIWSGTPFNARDPLYKAVESGAWYVNVYPVCEKFPCTREEFKGSWPDRFTYDYVMKQYTKAVKAGKVDSFNQELMLRIMSEEDRLIKDSEINWYARNALLKSKDAYNFYITTDFATSEKEASDFSVISVWALSSDGTWFWVDGICKQQDMSVNIDDLFRMVQIYRPLEVGIEISGQQKGFVSWIRREMGDKRCYFNLASENNEGEPGIRPSTKKIERFNVVVPLFKNHKIMFPSELANSKEMLEMQEELRLVARKGFKSKHDDFADTISMLPLLNSFMPSNDVVHKFNPDAQIWEEEDADDEERGFGDYAV